jgi:hypothetical protein
MLVNDHIKNYPITRQNLQKSAIWLGNHCVTPPVFTVYSEKMLAESRLVEYRRVLCQSGCVLSHTKSDRQENTTVRTNQYNLICPKGHLPLMAICILPPVGFWPSAAGDLLKQSVLNRHWIMVPRVTTWERFDCTCKQTGTKFANWPILCGVTRWNDTWPDSGKTPRHSSTLVGKSIKL